VNVVLPPPEGGSERAQLGSAVVPAAVPAVPEPDAVSGSGPLVDNLRPDPTRAAGAPAQRSDDRNRRPPPRTAAFRRPQPSTDEITPRNAAALVKQARAHEKAGQWSDARAIYQRLVKVKGYAGEAYFRQAMAAFQANQLDEAIQLTMEAAKQPGTFKTDALILYGDVLFRQKEYERAKTIYLGVRKTVAGEPRAVITRKIARCNEQLRLPESDGLARD
jgi:tetratricopeptide (TPR) repeat protein